MITGRDLKQAGYRRYPEASKGPFCKGLWQRWVKEGNAKLYAINFYMWKFPDSHSGFTVEVRMYTKEAEFDLGLLIDGRTIEEVEAFYASSYQALNGVPNRHYN